ncbi:hypothetical protein PAMP_001015 [Pampus punctatissimus]
MKGDIYGRIDSLAFDLRSENASVKQDLENTVEPMLQRLNEHDQTMHELERAYTDNGTELSRLDSTVNSLKAQVKLLNDKCRQAREIVLKYEGRLTRTRGYQTAGADLLKKLSRVLYNIVVLFIPWEVRIKKIESHFGSGVASYFIFLRWLFGINIVLTIMTGAFIVLPEVLAGAPFGTTRSKTIPKEHLASAQDLDTIWSLGGYLQYSVLFYGYYGRVRKIGSAGYRLPLAYFLVGMAVFAYSFIILLRKMAKNSRLSLASASDENFTFCWRVFCAWDYLIGNPEAAESKGAAIVNNIREAIVEEQEKKKDTSLAVLISLRILANILVLLSLAGSIYIIYFVVDRSQKLEQEKPELTLWEKNEVSVVVSLITMIAPSAFELVAQLEMYHPRTSLRFQLARVLVLYLGNLYSLIIALLDKVNSMSSAIQVSPGNWSDSSSFLATISQPEVDSLSTLVSEIYVSDPRNSTIATIATVLDVTNSSRSSSGIVTNQTALFEKNTRSQQDQCWETYVGQEMLKLSIIDMIFTVASILLIDFIRGLVVRYLSDCCCWDLESKFIKQLLLSYAAFHVVSVYAAHHLCHSEIQTITALWTIQHADILSAVHCQIPQIHQQPAEDAAPDCEWKNCAYLLNYSTFVLCNITSWQPTMCRKRQTFLLARGLTVYWWRYGISSKYINTRGQERTEDKKKVFQMAAARLQAPVAAADKKADQQDSDITSQEASVDTPSPRRNGSVINFQSPVHRGNSIHTITQSASRLDLSKGSVAGSSRSPTVSILPKHRLEHIPNRPSPFLGGPIGTCRSRSYHHMAYNPPASYSDNIQSDPLYRKTSRPIHPVETAGIIAAQSYGGRRGHTTRYVIVNEHEPRKKLLRSATRIPRHYLMEEPAEILELYPRNIKRYTPCTAHHQANPHRSHKSQQHLSEEEEEEEEGKGRRRMTLGKTHWPRSLSELHQPAHFYIGEHAESHMFMAKHSTAARGRYGVQEGDGEEEMDWRELESHSRSQANERGADPVQVQTRRHMHSPGRHCQSPARTRHMESHVKPRTRPKFEPPLTESDSASLASSSDQQNSSTDQYIQIIHNKERYLKSNTRQGKLAKKKSKTNFDLNDSESNDLVCSNV